MNKKIIAALSLTALIAAAAVLAYIAVPRILIASLAKSYGLDISYKHAAFTPRFDAHDNGGFKIDADLRDVRIFRKGKIPEAYENLEALVSAPFDGSLKYRDIKGTIRPRKGHILIDDLIADGNDIKVSLKGTFFYAEDKADLNIVIQFSKNLLKKVPKELSDTVLRESPDGWQSLSVNLKGSFNSPSLEVTGRLFRLTIREVSGS